MLVKVGPDHQPIDAYICVHVGVELQMYKFMHWPLMSVCISGLASKCKRGKRRYKVIIFYWHKVALIFGIENDTSVYTTSCFSRQIQNTYFLFCWQNAYFKQNPAVAFMVILYPRRAPCCVGYPTPLERLIPIVHSNRNWQHNRSLQRRPCNNNTISLCASIHPTYRNLRHFRGHCIQTMSLKHIQGLCMICIIRKTSRLGMVLKTKHNRWLWQQATHKGGVGRYITMDSVWTPCIVLLTGRVHRDRHP